jgi:hypothetical protein
VLRISPRALDALSTPAAALLLAGCSGGPGRVAMPSISASGAASEALELYDKDGDGFIADAELDAVPGIKAAMKTIDANSDGKVTEEEIAARIEKWQEFNAGVMAISCSFTLDGKPLAGAQVTFEPESFLGDELIAATGETSPSGTVAPIIPKDKRPTPDTPPGMQMGLYRIRVTRNGGEGESLPARFNTETILGQQISPDDPAIAGQRMRFELTTR